MSAGRGEEEGATPEAAVRWRIEGRVQGVGFRYFTLRTARRHGLVGRVRNLPDGAVEVEAAGDEVELARCKAELAEGPATARVRQIREQPLASVPDWDRFEIAY